MKQRFIKNTNFNAAVVEKLVDGGVIRPFAEVLSTRGITAETLPRFVNFDINNMYDPFLMHGMTEAVAVLTEVFSFGGSVLIFGDYDADGLSAASLLSLFLTHNGIDNTIIIPTREEGYGIYVDKILAAYEDNWYDVIVTVDCGISNREEIAQLKDTLGADLDIIVTDHHECPPVLPDCICVNPKLGYPFKYLSGSGVAYKLVEALSDRQTATQYADLAIIGTIADIMPLVDENRDLVRLGLNNFNHKGLVALANASKCNKPVTVSDIGMRIAPKINAAGRMGSPDIALKVLLASEKADNTDIDTLGTINEERKVATDAIVKHALSALDSDEVYRDKMCFVVGKNWNGGLLGIVAARLKEQFNLPVFVLTEAEEGVYKGSARGTANKDLFLALSDCRDCLVRFGGHKNAVGFSVETDKIDQLRTQLAAALASQSEVEPPTYFDLELDNSMPLADFFAFSEAFQPIMSSQSIVFRVRDHVKVANAFGQNNAHLSVTLASGLEVKSFYRFTEFLPMLKAGADVDMLVTLSIDSYTKNITATLVDIELNNSLHFEQHYVLTYIKNIAEGDVEYVAMNTAKDKLKGNSVLVIFDRYSDFLEVSKTVDFDDFYISFFYTGQQNAKTVLISPAGGNNFGSFSDVIVFASDGSVQRSYFTGVTVTKLATPDILADIKLTRDICLDVYKVLKNKTKYDSIATVYDKYLLSKITLPQYYAAIKVFEELKLLKVVGEFDIVFSNIKVELTDSVLYNSLV
jgi:single-stranded-DNA-specific exonuclease